MVSIKIYCNGDRTFPNIQETIFFSGKINVNRKKYRKKLLLMKHGLSMRALNGLESRCLKTMLSKLLIRSLSNILHQ